jgi:hypothetical protein
MMLCERFPAPEDWDEVRGPELVRWLTDEDLRFPDLGDAYGPPNGRIVGALSHGHWVIFHGLQVIQIVPDEVHSAWHYDFMRKPHPLGSAWRIIDSRWRASFDPQHLADHSHFIIRFYDDVVELICRDLLFGPAPFDLTAAINCQPKLAYSYLQLAVSLEKRGDQPGALANYEKYLHLEPDPRTIDYARRSIERLRGR